MPTEREREYYRMGFDDGLKSVQREADRYRPSRARVEVKSSRRKLSAWNKFVKANSKKPRFRLRSGKLNLKKMGVAFRKTPASRKK
jgi:hypothetical protein